MGNDGNKKKVALLGVSGLMLVVIGTAVTVGLTKNNSGGSSKDGGSVGGSNGGEVSASMKAIQALCQPTDYKETCIKSLQTAGPNTTDPKELIKVGFKVAMEKISEAGSKSMTLKELEKDPMASQALENCKELMEDAIDDLKASFEKLGSLDISKIDDALEDLKIWLSAVRTYEETCLDGFVNLTTDAGAKMREALNMSIELTSNGLAMVDEVGTILASLNIPGIGDRRRLLQVHNDLMGHDDYPTWIDPTRRRLLATNINAIKPDIIVAKDGSGQYNNINVALKAIPAKSIKPFVIYIKAGVYQEQVVFPKKANNLVLIGDGPTKSRITFNKNYADGTQTYKTATVSIFGENFLAKDIGFENSAGAIKHQAVALLVQSEKAVFYNCQMDGYQDTLYVHSKRQFYRDCTITGTIDFIFGDAAAVFQNCKILVRRPLDNQQCIVTAQGRKDRRQASALILQGCTITGDESYLPVKDRFRSYLGRPWKEYSRTIIMQTYIDSIIQPEGWLPWLGDFGLKTCFYTEVNNRGPGADTSNRVKWRGIKTITPQHAINFTPGRFFKGDSWITLTGVPYTAGMVAV